jgi:FixJ family two-component response regulator
MPGTSGPELATRLAALVPDAPIVLMSGFDRVDLPDGLAAQFLRKPFTEEELLGALDRGAGLRNH